MEQKLNTKQQQLISQNHNLIYGFAHKRKLNLDEYYDILALALCRAALSYDSHKSSFQTYAYMIMGSEVNAYQRALNKPKRKLDKSIKEIRLDELFDNHNNHSNHSSSIIKNSSIGEFTIHPSIPLSEMCEGKIMAEKMLSVLSNKEQKIVMGKKEGLTNYEIGKQLKCSAQNIDYYIRKIRRKWVKHFDLIV